MAAEVKAVATEEAPVQGGTGASGGTSAAEVRAVASEAATAAGAQGGLGGAIQIAAAAVHDRLGWHQLTTPPLGVNARYA